MRTTWFYIVIIVATIIGWIFYEWLKKKLQPGQSARKGLVFLLASLVFIVGYSAGIVFLVRLIFGKPS